jgi:hypothetical protein
MKRSDAREGQLITWQETQGDKNHRRVLQGQILQTSIYKVKIYIFTDGRTFWTNYSNIEIEAE